MKRRQKKERGIKNRQIEVSNKTEDLKTNISAITLNVNRLYALVKRHKLSD